MASLWEPEEGRGGPAIMGPTVPRCAPRCRPPLRGEPGLTPLYQLCRLHDKLLPVLPILGARILNTGSTAVYQAQTCMFDAICINFQVRSL